MSLVMYILVVSPVGYLKDSVASSYSGKYLFKVAPAIYSGLWKGIASKFISQEKFNQNILEIPQNPIPEK